MEIVNPLSAADPPEAPVTVTPVKLNWNPPFEIDQELEKMTNDFIKK